MLEFRASDSGDLQASVTLRSWCGARDASGPYASRCSQEPNREVNALLLRTGREAAEAPSPRELGHRLIKSQTDADSSEFDHGQIDRTAFVITRCDAPEVFDFVEEALDGITGFVEVRTEADRMLAV